MIREFFELRPWIVITVLASALVAVLLAAGAIIVVVTHMMESAK